MTSSLDSGSSVSRPNVRDGEGFGVLTDLALVALATLLTVLFGWVYGQNGGPAVLRVPLGFLFVFFLPGYAITAALFPGRAVDDGRSRGRPTVTAVERFVLAVGLSIVVSPLVGLVLSLVSVTITLQSILGGISLVTLTSLTIAVSRRLRLPPRERFRLGVRRHFLRLVDYATANVLNLLIVVGLVLAVSGIGFAVTASEGDERYTEFALLSETEGSDELVADEYPTEFTQGESRTLYTEIVNNEKQTVEYTVVVQLQELASEGDASTAVAVVELERADVTLGHEQRTVYEHDVSPPISGERLRLTYLLYRGEPPAEPSPSNAYRAVYLNIDVDE